jgi:hypothetical protein
MEHTVFQWRLLNATARYYAVQGCTHQCVLKWQYVQNSSYITNNVTVGCVPVYWLYVR